MNWILYGFLWGFACLLNPAIFAAMPFVFLWHLWMSRHEITKSVRVLGISLAAFLVICAPWSIRNDRVFHEFVPFRSSFGYELWLGNNPGVPHAWLGASAELDPLYSPTEFADFQREGEVAYIQVRKAEAIRFIKTHPAEEVRFFLLKFATFWTGTWYMPVDTSWKATHWRFRIIEISETLLPFLALPGIWLAWRENRTAAIPAFSFLLFFPLVYYITHAHTGYKNPMDPVLVLFAAIFFDRLWFRHPSSIARV